MWLAAAICELLVLTMPFTEAVPIPITPAVTKTTKVIKSVYSIKSWPSSSLPQGPAATAFLITSKVITTDRGGQIKRNTS